MRLRAWKESTHTVKEANHAESIEQTSQLEIHVRQMLWTGQRAKKLRQVFSVATLMKNFSFGNLQSLLLGPCLK